MKQDLSPIREQQRIVSLDVMRGTAILGIFLVNMLSFHSPLLYIDPIEWWQDSVDKGFYIFIDIFVQASFYPLFSMLFGYGLVIFRERVQNKNLSFTPIAIRRLFLLLIVGFIHAIFIWHGDILFNYALFGFLFLLFVKLSGRTLMILGNMVYLLPNLLLSALLFLSMLIAPAEELSTYHPLLSAESIDRYQNGSYLEITIQRVADWTYTNNMFGLFMMLFTILPLFFIGGSAAKYKWLERIQACRRGLWITLIISFLLGLSLKLLPYIWTNIGTNYIQDMFGGPLLAISYGLMIALFTEKQPLNKAFTLISYVGRMSFSHYLLQSIIATLIFYSYGLGLYGETSVWVGTLLVFIIYLLQCIFSRLWFAHYHFGPAEWIWRSFTYFKRQPLRKQTKDVS
ncbi:DUF418 domain-containing protein [Bacillus tuaregi]|uniref:DUF418 domain-containing protein n=1 Tax=Bacillus tuaregi TaxID=1816695 RepID=UPI0008F97150|nr:DUF418 domain-containing protein [Bacillus tuaregi]